MPCADGSSCPGRRLELLHLPLPSSQRPMRILNTILLGAGLPAGSHDARHHNCVDLPLPHMACAMRIGSVQFARMNVNSCAIVALLYSASRCQWCLGCVWSSIGKRRSRVRASLRDQPFGSPSMGSGDGVEQSDSRPDRAEPHDRHKSPSELTPSIVPRGTSIRRRRNSIFQLFDGKPSFRSGGG
jgi:hypothetical protein